MSLSAARSFENRSRCHLQPGDEIARARIEPSGADDNVAGLRVRQGGAVEVMTRHDVRGLLAGGSEGRVPKAERTNDARLEKIRIRLMRRPAERGGEQVKAEVGI